MTPPAYRKTSKVEVHQLSYGAILQGVPLSEETPSIAYE